MGLGDVEGLSVSDAFRSQPRFELRAENYHDTQPHHDSYSSRFQEMQANTASRLYNKRLQIQIVQVTSIMEYTGQITSIYNDNVRSIVQIATNIGTIKNGPNAAGSRQRNSVFEEVPSPGYKQMLGYTKQKVGRVGESRQPTCFKHILLQTYRKYWPAQFEQLSFIYP